jgi:hypothetical protein
MLTCAFRGFSAGLRTFVGLLSQLWVRRYTYVINIMYRHNEKSMSYIGVRRKSAMTSSMR